jgi:hypothetical protein
MNEIKLESFDIEKLRERLRKMTDAQLLEGSRPVSGFHERRPV